MLLAYSGKPLIFKNKRNTCWSFFPNPTLKKNSATARRPSQVLSTQFYRRSSQVYHTERPPFCVEDDVRDSMRRICPAATAEAFYQ